MIRPVIPPLLVFLLATAGAAQTPKAGQGSDPPAPVEQAPPATQPTQAPPPAGESYTYAPDGRRDPFLSLLSAGGTGGTPADHVDGPAGLLTAELSVRGVVKSRGALLAMVQGPDNRTYVIRAGDKLRDGLVKAVNPDGLLIIQDIADPLSLQRQREVRRLLRTLEDATE
jgi:hypothetical protein